MIVQAGIGKACWRYCTFGMIPDLAFSALFLAVRICVAVYVVVTCRKAPKATILPTQVYKSASSVTGDFGLPVVYNREHHVEWQVQTRYTRPCEQLLEGHKLRTACDLVAKPRAAVVYDFARQIALLHIPSNTNHAQHPHDNALSIMAKWWRSCTSPFALSRSQHGCIKPPKCARDEIDGRVCGCIIEHSRYVADKMPLELRCPEASTIPEVRH